MYLESKESIRLVLVRRVFTSSISNRAVKPRTADGTAVTSGRVGRCHLNEIARQGRFSKEMRPCLRYKNFILNLLYGDQIQKLWSGLYFSRFVIQSNLARFGEFLAPHSVSVT